MLNAKSISCLPMVGGTFASFPFVPQKENIQRHILLILGQHRLSLPQHPAEIEWNYRSYYKYILLHCHKAIRHWHMGTSGVLPCLGFVCVYSMSWHLDVFRTKCCIFWHIPFLFFFCIHYTHTRMSEHKYIRFWIFIYHITCFCYFIIPLSFSAKHK